MLVDMKSLTREEKVDACLEIHRSRSEVPPSGISAMRNWRLHLQTDTDRVTASKSWGVADERRRRRWAAHFLGWMRSMTPQMGEVMCGSTKAGSRSWGSLGKVASPMCIWSRKCSHPTRPLSLLLAKKVKDPSHLSGSLTFKSFLRLYFPPVGFYDLG